MKSKITDIPLQIEGKQLHGKYYHPEKDIIINTQGTVYRRQPDGNLSVPVKCERIKVTQSDIDAALKRFKYSKTAQISSKKTTTTLNTDQKVRISLDIDSGMSVKGIMEKHDVSMSTVYRMQNENKQMEAVWKYTNDTP